jgi:hypothetical protein
VFTLKKLGKDEAKNIAEESRPRVDGSSCPFANSISILPKGHKLRASVGMTNTSTNHYHSSRLIGRVHQSIHAFFSNARWLTKGTRSTLALLLLILSTTIRLSLLENKAGGKWRASLHAFDMRVRLAIQPPLSFQRRKYMSVSIKINRGIFDRVKTAIGEAGRINMLSWAEGQDSAPAESVNKIRELPLLGDCRTMACIGGLIYYLATSQEIASRTDCGRGRQRSQSGDDSYAYCKKENSQK